MKRLSWEQFRREGIVVGNSMIDDIRYLIVLAKFVEPSSSPAGSAVLGLITATMLANVPALERMRIPTRLITWSSHS